MAILNVSNQTQLDAALVAADDGDTILLAAGTYSRLTMNSGRIKDYNFDSKLTIASANSYNPAVIRELYVNNASNIEFENLEFDYTGYNTSSTPDFLDRGHFYLTNIEDVTIADSDFEGQIQNGHGAGWGLRVRDADGFELTGSTISDFKDGLSVYNSADVTIEGNEIRGMSGDGMFLGGLDGVRVENNTLHQYDSPNPTARHQDNIQFYSTPGKIPLSNDVVIRGNEIESSDNRHAIYMGNEFYIAGDKSAFYRNVLIEDNDIRTANHHGVAVVHGDGVTIRDNDIVPYSSSSLQTPVISVSVLSRNVKILDNEVTSVPVAQNGTWTVSGNDTGGPRNFLHHYWVIDGTKIRTTPATETPTDDDDDDDDEDVTPTVDVFRIDGGDLDGEDRFVAGNVDFEAGDMFVFNNFDDGTFLSRYGNNPIWSRLDNSAVTIKSVLDFQELAAVSPKVSAWASGDDLVVYIDQDGGDAARVVFEDMGPAFQAANQPWLF